MSQEEKAIKIITVTFDFSSSKIYETLHEVFLYSAEKNLKNAEIISITLDEPELNGRVRGFVTNTIKLTQWVNELNASQDGDYIALLDCDMLIINDFSSVFDLDFDVAYTFRTRCKYPVNGGVIFVKINDRSRTFFNRFLEINNKMFQDKVFHQEWRNKYAGMNQAAFGYLLEKESNIANLVGIPCRKWNVCQDDWKDYDDDAKIIHVKGQLRQAIFNGSTKVDPELKPAVELWRLYYNEMLGAKVKQ